MKAKIKRRPFTLGRGVPGGNRDAAAAVT